MNQRNLGSCEDWVRGQESLGRYILAISRRDGSSLVERTETFVQESGMPLELLDSFYKLLRDYCNYGSSSNADSRDEVYQQLRTVLKLKT